MRLVLACLALFAIAGPARGEEAVMRRRVVTSDGVPLALYRYVPLGGGAQRRPVLLVPDLTLGREAFDLAGDGLARWLQARGREVFLVELRGHGRSGVPRRWSLEDIVTRDLPAVAEVLDAARPGKFDLVAHGWAGTLALVATTTTLEGRVERVVAINTPVEPEPGGIVLEEILSSGGGFERLALEPSGAERFERLYARRGLFPPRRLRELRGTGLNDLGDGVARELLDWMRRGELTLKGKGVRDWLAGYDRPTQLVLGLGDSFANPEFCSPLRDVATSASIEVRLLSRVHLLAEDYSHLSLLHGRDAPKDVFAPLLRFLDGAGAKGPALAEESP